jgi:TldD protein
MKMIQPRIRRQPAPVSLPSRRQFLQRSSAAFFAAALSPALVQAGSRRAWEATARATANDLTRVATDPTLLAILDRAIEAATAAGATYADARYQMSDGEGWWSNSNEIHSPWLPRDAAIGVRALYNGSWGYAAATLESVSADFAAQLGREAAGQAKVVSNGRPRPVTLAQAPVIASGTWTTPIEIDPFTVPWDEKIDFMHGLLDFVSQYDAGARIQFDLKRDTTAFSSTEGSRYTQTLYRVAAEYTIGVNPDWRTRRGAMRTGESFMSMAGAGWEYLAKGPFEQESLRMIDEAKATRYPASIPIDVGRYDVVFDGVATGKMADLQLGAATELDRAMGYLANGQGTSYVNDPLGMLGNRQMGSPLLTVTANRSMPRGAATVQWDAEGTVPDDAVLIKNGVLTDFQTTRESAGWLADYYQKQRLPIRSHGGATTHFMEEEPRQGAHNLVVTSSSENRSFAELCAGIKRGLAVRSWRGISGDQQVLNAESTGELVYEIRDGKLGRVVDGAVFLTRAPDLWKHLISLGGPDSVCTVGTNRRGDMYSAPHTVSAPAAAFKQVPVIRNEARMP